MPNPEVVSEIVPEVKPEAIAPDPFALDENSLASLSPEQRAGLEPIIDSWKKRATEEISKRESAVSSKYKPFEEKATALDKLTAYAPFVQWWQAQQSQAMHGATDQQKAAVQGTQPQDVATQTEWQEAIWNASNGDSTKLQELQKRMMGAWLSPAFQQMTERQQIIDTKIELKDLFDNHPDAKELDRIGLDAKGEGISLLEMALDWAEKNRKPLEEGYLLAKSWRDHMSTGAQQEAMGLVQGKKQTVTQGPSTSQVTKNIIEVADTDELLKRSLEAQLSGQKDVQFVVRGKR